MLVSPQAKERKVICTPAAAVSPAPLALPGSRHTLPPRLPLHVLGSHAGAPQPGSPPPA
jgi:hypothetical protein